MTSHAMSDLQSRPVGEGRIVPGLDAWREAIAYQR